MLNLRRKEIFVFEFKTKNLSFIIRKWGDYLKKYHELEVVSGELFCCEIINNI